MMNFLSEKMIVHYHFRNKVINLALSCAVSIGFALSLIFFMIFSLSRANQVLFGQGLILFLLIMSLPLIVLPLVQKRAKKALGKAFFLVLFAIASAMFMLLYYLAPYIYFISQNVDILIFRSLFAFLIILFCLPMVYEMWVFLFKRHLPALILNCTGVWVTHFGLIPWDNIAEIGPSSTTTTCINIRVIDPVALRSQAAWLGKLNLFLLNIYTRFGYTSYYHISITYLDTPNDAIIAFAHQYMQRDTQN